MPVLFGIIAATTIVSALGVVLSKRPVYSILSLIICLYAIGALYLALHAEFLAIVHLIVYAGAIMVLFLFVIMLLNLDRPEHHNRSRLLQWTALGITISLALVIALVLQTPPTSWTVAPMGSVQAIGRLLFSKFIAPFELSAVLFLAAIVGVVITSKKPQPEGDASE